MFCNCSVLEGRIQLQHLSFIVFYKARTNGLSPVLISWALLGVGLHREGVRISYTRCFLEEEQAKQIFGFERPANRTASTQEEVQASSR